MTGSTEHGSRPFYFTVVFWGATHRGYFADLLAASLLAPGNIPALDRKRASKFLIVTTREDWDALQSNPLFLELKKHIEPVWFEMEMPGPEDSKMLVMSAGHKLMASRCFEDRAIGVFVTPDLILSDGSCVTLERLADSGKKVVLAVAIRFQHEELLGAMQHEGFFKPGEVLTIGARPLCRLAIAHLHSETLRYEWDSPWLADSPISAYWHVPGGAGMVIHSFSWAPLVVNYGLIENHDTSTFEKWTLDGDYIHRNVRDANDTYIVTDSDELMLVSFTKESELHFDLVPEPHKQDPIIGPWVKVGLLRNLRNSPVMDDLKRDILPVAVRLHWGELGSRWDEMLAHAARIVETASQPPSFAERSSYVIKRAMDWWRARKAQLRADLEQQGDAIQQLVAAYDRRDFLGLVRCALVMAWGWLCLHAARARASFREWRWRRYERVRYYLTLLIGRAAPLARRVLDRFGMTDRVRGRLNQALVYAFGPPPSPTAVPSKDSERAA